MRLLALAIVLVLIGAVVMVVLWGPWRPSKEDLMKQAGLTGKRELLVGVCGCGPGGISMHEPATGQFTGFDIEIAYLIAADLGFRNSEVRFFLLESEDRPKMQARDGDKFVTVDLVISSYSITKEREDLPNVSFSAPYLRTEQSVVTRKDHPKVHTLEDLRDKRVCTTTTATSEGPARKAGVLLIGNKQVSECISGLLRGEYEAVTSDAAILAGFVTKYPEELKHHDIGLADEERWGVNTGGNEALRTLVNLSLCRSLHDPRDRRWEDAFDRYLRPAQPVNLPQQVAVDRQPDVEKVDVRTWPWELPSACR